MYRSSDRSGQGRTRLPAPTRVGPPRPVEARTILLGSSGGVLAVSGSWDDAPGPSLPHRVVGRGVDYAAACEAMQATLGARASALADQLRRVLAGQLDRFSFEYPGLSFDAAGIVRLEVCAWAGESVRGAMVLCTRVDSADGPGDRMRDLEARYATLFLRNALPMWAYDPDSLHILAVNDAAVAHYGYDREEFLSLTIADIRPADEAHALLADVIEKRQHEVDASRRIWRHRIKDGSIIDVEIHAHQIAWNGRKARLVTAQDVTSRLAAMRALQESETRFRQITDCISEAFLLMEGTRLLYVSPGYEAIWGRSSRDLQDGLHHWGDSIHPDDKERVLQALPLQFSGQYDIEYRIVRPDGRLVWVADRAFPVVGTDDGAPEARRLVGVARDITQRKTVEQQLQQSQRLESIGQLTGGIAHDFNNLLTVILGNAELLAEQLPADALHHRLALMIGNAAQRGADLVQRLLAFARKQALEPRIVNVGRLLQDMDDMLRRTLGGQIEVTRRGAQDVWSTLIDPTQLESALLNLAINARDAMPGGGRLTFAVHNLSLASTSSAGFRGTPGDYVALQVSDTGAGIPEDQLPRVFEPFYTTKERGKGTGLGLAMVYGFVKQSNGHVVIESRVGQGTSVSIYLPRHQGIDAARPESEEVEAPLGSGQRVLLVEDDDMVRHYVRSQLESLQYRVVEATNGVEALAVLAQEAVDLLFTDVIMPGGMSGADLARAARALKPALPVLYTSGYTESALSSNGHLEPGVLLLGKPYRRTDLANKLRLALSAAAPRDRQGDRR